MKLSSAKMKAKAYLRNRGRGYSKRYINRYPVRQRFLIVCEGEATEPKYFCKFRASGFVIHVKGTGRNTLKIVEEALRLRQDEDYDQVWCVFDRDSNPRENFNAALTLAAQNKIEVAYSNQAFELWYLLHFQYQNTAITRRDYIQRLERRLNRPYQKNDDTIFDELRPYVDEAIRNARRLLEGYRPSNPADDDPSTTVHILVEQLLKFAGPVVQR